MLKSAELNLRVNTVRPAHIHDPPGRGARFTAVIPAGGGSRDRGSQFNTVECLAAAKEANRLPKHKRCRVLIVEDRKMLRDKLSELLQLDMNIAVVGEAENGHQAIALAERLVPDVILMDVNLKGMSGMETTSKILAANPAIKVIGLSMHTDTAISDAMRNAGAIDYLAKGVSVCDVVKAILTCCIG